MLYNIYNGGKFISRGQGTHITRQIESDELIYVMRGELAMFEEEKSFFLSAGDFLILRKNRLHGGLKNYPKDLIFFWLHFQDLDDFLETFPQTGKIREESLLSNYLQNFLLEQSRYQVDRKILDLLFQLIFQEILRSGGKKISENFSVTPLAGAAKEYLLGHYKEEALSLASAAKALHCNKEYLGRIFLNSFGESFVKMLNKKRLEFACFLLRENPSMSIKEVALSSGFRDVSYFHRIFHPSMGMTPSQYRMKHASCHKNF